MATERPPGEAAGTWVKRADDLHGAGPESDFFVSTPRGRFLKGPDGTPKLGDVPVFPGAPHTEGTLDIWLRRGDIDHVDTPAKRVEAQSLGYQDGLHLTVDVAENWTSVRRGHDGRLILSKPNGPHRVAVVELQKGRDFYKILTSGVRDPDRLHIDAEELWQRPRPTSSAPAGSTPPLNPSPLDADAAKVSTSGQSVSNIVSLGDIESNVARISAADDIKATPAELRAENAPAAAASRRARQPAFRARIAAVVKRRRAPRPARGAEPFLPAKR